MRLCNSVTAGLVIIIMFVMDCHAREGKKKNKTKWQEINHTQLLKTQYLRPALWTETVVQKQKTGGRLKKN